MRQINRLSYTYMEMKSSLHDDYICSCLLTGIIATKIMAGYILEIILKCSFFTYIIEDPCNFVRVYRALPWEFLKRLLADSVFKDSD